MDSIIGTRRYNTETAKKVLSVESDIHTDSYYKEDLYQKRTGEYFLHCKGGPQSKYRDYNKGQGCWVESEVILPLSIDSMNSWVAENFDRDSDAIKDLFDPKDGDYTMISARISSKSKKLLSEQANRMGVSQAKVIDLLISDNL